MYQEGEITISRCQKCAETFPVFIFCGDTDMVTNSCVALTGQNKDIILTECKPEETSQKIEARIGSGYKIVNVRFEQNNSLSSGLSFKDFATAYKPATPIYTCIYCGSDSLAIKHETKVEFLAHNKIMVANGS